MSTDFETQNLISQHPSNQSFRLGVSQTSDQKPSIDYQVDSLAHASKYAWYEDLLKEGFPSDYQFLAKLTEFLLTTNATYLNICSGDKPFAMTNLAIANDIALIFNGVVSLPLRSKGIAGSLFKTALYEAHLRGAKELLFWTKHEGLLRYSESS